MAEKLRTYDFTRKSQMTKTDKATYPWAEWFDGDIWKLTHGTDFDPHPLMMERIIRTRATAEKGKVTLRHEPSAEGEDFGVIVLRRTDVTGPAEQKKAEAAAKRALRKAQAEKDAAATLEAAGIKPNGTATKTAKTVSKRPAKRPVAKTAA